jgi:hypothetical protein
MHVETCQIHTDDRHTGKPELQGEFGDDVLFGPAKTRSLDESLRRWLTNHPEELARITEERPDGPLAISLRTGGRGNQRTFDRRYDAVWVSEDFEVNNVAYPYAESVAAGSDHSAVVVALEWALLDDSASV